MRKRGAMQKGFLLTVLLLIGFVIAIAYLQEGSTGKSVHSASSSSGDECEKTMIDSVSVCAGDTVCVCAREGKVTVEQGPKCAPGCAPVFIDSQQLACLAAQEMAKNIKLECPEGCPKNNPETRVQPYHDHCCRVTVSLACYDKEKYFAD